MRLATPFARKLTGLQLSRRVLETKVRFGGRTPGERRHWGEQLVGGRSGSAEKVHSTVKGLFYTTAALSVLGGVCSLWYLTLLWSSRYVYFNAGLRRTVGDPGDLVGEQYSADDRNDAPAQLTVP
ncbi:hypothetical protein HPB50_019406 [Hyalomma asiaticum]|uniref:Uncharacterized protein n=1 Tax=Hyalomma asiaticum TaxID=266040 RepID=A0ACB7RVP1_HYAAI|nr:hypothetical protein HPB50_019406 [Hyalomma asiaticum]